MSFSSEGEKTQTDLECQLTTVQYSSLERILLDLELVLRLLPRREQILENDRKQALPTFRRSEEVWFDPAREEGNALDPGR
jgi:hypothetical protein